MGIKDALRQMFTEADNVTHSLAKYMGAGTALAGLFYQGWDVVVNHVAFSMQNFGMGAGSLFAGLAALFGFQKESLVRKDTQ